jgi:hypothetical protein
METGLSALNGIVFEHYFVKKAVGQPGELAIALLGEAHAGQQDNQKNPRNLHGVDYSDAPSVTLSFGPASPQGHSY